MRRIFLSFFYQEFLFFFSPLSPVFTLVLFIFIGCVITTIRSFREIPLDRLWATQSSSITSSGPGIGIGTARFVTEPQNHKVSPVRITYYVFSGQELRKINTLSRLLHKIRTECLQFRFLRYLGSQWGCK